MSEKQNRIFTFWEPKEKMPEYIKLCIQTWKKFLPEYEIVILDYKSLNDWLPPNYYDKYLYKNFSLPIQADAIRCALLKQYGGIWMDADTIVTSENIKNFLNNSANFVLINSGIGFIAADKDSGILKQWQRYIFKKIALHKKYRNVFTFIFNYKFYRKFKDWAYLGNSIINHITTGKSEKEFYSIPLFKNYIMPERNFARNNSINASVEAIYRDLYFEENIADYVLKNTKGLIMLHNSWTPKEFKTMSKKKFLKQDVTISNLLKKLLNL